MIAPGCWLCFDRHEDTLWAAGPAECSPPLQLTVMYAHDQGRSRSPTTIHQGACVLSCVCRDAKPYELLAVMWEKLPWSWELDYTQACTHSCATSSSCHACVYVRPTRLLVSSLFLASFIFLLGDIAQMIHITYISHMVQNLVKQSYFIFQICHVQTSILQLILVQN